FTVGESGHPSVKLIAARCNNLRHHEHADVLTVGFNVDGVERVLDLRLNTDLIPVGYQQLHQHRGTYKVHTPSKVVSTAWASSIHIRSVLTAFPQTTFALIDIEHKRNSIGYQTPI
ncbi:hypothetical protein ALC57_07841, partial [Trachymyrmex cornetzi]